MPIYFEKLLTFRVWRGPTRLGLALLLAAAGGCQSGENDAASSSVAATETARADAPPMTAANSGPAAHADTSTSAGATASLPTTVPGLRERAESLQEKVYRFLSPDAPQSGSPRERLATAWVELIEIVLEEDDLRSRHQRFRETFDVQIGLFLARHRSLSDEIAASQAAKEPHEPQERHVAGVNFWNDPFPQKPAPAVKTPWGELPADSVTNEWRLLLHLLRRYAPELAADVARNLYPEIDNDLFRTAYDFSRVPPRMRPAYPVPPTKDVPAVPDKGRACAEFVVGYVRDVVPVQRILRQFRHDIPARFPRFEQLHASVMGKTSQQLFEEWASGAEPDPLLQIRDLVSEIHPQQAAAFTAFVKMRTAPMLNANQRRAQETLREIAAAQKQFRDRDLDGNGVTDYWTADVSGLNRLLVDGKPLRLVDETVARGDVAPLNDAKHLHEREAPPTVGDASTSQTPDYWLKVVEFDSAGERYAQETRQNGQPWRNGQRFAVCAYPRGYGRTGRQTYLITEEGVIRFTDTEGRPVTRLPKDFEADGWTAVESPAED